MSEDIVDKQVIERFQVLKKKRAEILTLPPAKALDRILNDPNALELVQSFPEQDLYFLIQDIGPENSLPVLSLASNRQWEYIVDLETWQKDRIEMNSVTRWMNLLLEVDPKRFVQWFLNEKLEFMQFYLFKNIEVRVREHDQDPSDFGDNFFTLDDTYYVRFIETPLSKKSGGPAEVQRQKLMRKLTRYLADYDHRTYQNILLEATHVIPAETEEECYRRRNVRLAEKGFLPFDEAIGIYQPIKPQDLKRPSSKNTPQTGDDPSLLPVPQYHFKMLKEVNYFTCALRMIEEGAVLLQIQTEFANLCNQIIVADHKTIRERDQLKAIVKKVCGYISLGLERLSEAKKGLNPYQAAGLIAKYPLAQLFKVGFGGALELKWRAEKWLPQCWFTQAGLRLTFWGEQWLGVLGGLLIKKPLFYDNYKTGVLYREFESLDDIKFTENIFNHIKAIDDLLSLMSIHLDTPSAYGFLNFKNLILTLWARNFLGLSTNKLEPLKMNQFKPFYEKLLPGKPDPQTNKPRKIPGEMKALFLNWLTGETGLKDFEITDRLGRTLEDLFEELENEYGRVAAEDLDPRYVHLFLLRKAKK